MKSRASFFNPTVFRKNLTRFAPAWALAALYYLITVVLLVSDEPDNICNNGDVLFYTVILIHIFYAFLVAQLLFGDLYQSRLCNGLHSLPLRRECWFVTNVASGLVFLLIPLAVLCGSTAVAALGCSDPEALLVAPRLFLTGCLSYVSFFGLAVLASLCVGKRFAAALVYGLLNFGVVLVYGLAQLLYVPEHYGVVIQFDSFTRFCPLLSMLSDGFLTAAGFYTFWLWSILGIAALVVALLLYRRRQLERAGDFIAVGALEPVFLLVYTLSAVLLFTLFWDQSSYRVFIYLGVAVGWFTGLMLLRRTTRVFRKKTLLGCAGMMLALALSFGLNALDPLNIQHRIPGEANIKCAYVATSPYQITNYREDTDYVLRLDSPEDIATVLRLHALALEEYDADPEEKASGFSHGNRVVIGYDLADGTQMLRAYQCDTNGQCVDIARQFLSRTECVLGITREEAAQGSRHFSEYVTFGETEVQLTQEQMDGLVAALAADCDEGRTADYYSFRDDTLPDTDEPMYYIWLMRGTRQHLYLYVRESWMHTVAWLEENGFRQYASESEKY